MGADKEKELLVYYVLLFVIGALLGGGLLVTIFGDVSDRNGWIILLSILLGAWIGVVLWLRNLGFFSKPKL